MARSPRISFVLVALALCAVASAAVAAPRARAQSYTDVPKSHWAHASISAVTERTAAGHRLLDDYGSVFKPEQAITRAQLARTLVLASGHYDEQIAAVEINDVAPGHRYYSVIEMAVHLGFMNLDSEGDFKPDAPVLAWKAEAAIVRWIKARYPASDWALLTTLAPSRWRPNEGWRTAAPSYLPVIVASRQLQLKFNHPDTADGHEVTPLQPIDRAEIAYMIDRGYKAGGEYGLYGLGAFKSVSFPAFSERQKRVADFALKLVGYPYIWAGEYPGKASPYGYQAAGGFDCSGFVFYVMKMHFGYPLTVNERGAHDMAERAKPRIARGGLKGGDLIFFGPNGTKSTVGSIYHAALYLGNGWFIHSTGSSDGVTLASLDSSSYWKNAFAWGRRLLTPEELAVTAPQAAASSAATTGAAETVPSTAASTLPDAP